MPGLPVLNDMVTPPFGFGFGFPHDVPWNQRADTLGDGEAHEIAFNPFTGTLFPIH